MTDPTPKPLAPLVTDEQIDDLCEERFPLPPTVDEETLAMAASIGVAFSLGGSMVRDIYEPSRAKDHDLMREAVRLLGEWNDRTNGNSILSEETDALLTSLTERINTH